MWLLNPFTRGGRSYECSAPLDSRQRLIIITYIYVQNDAILHWAELLRSCPHKHPLDGFKPESGVQIWNCQLRPDILHFRSLRHDILDFLSNNQAGLSLCLLTAENKQDKRWPHGDNEPVRLCRRCHVYGQQTNKVRLTLQSATV